ncbi:RsfA family transcriptional regulator [Virgibacillus halodenitrificans]|uniref:Transcriptional regulator n=1 Tax=Virgibacillus halodenitrificans TaxID=1482 RepID=A0AAC9IZT2_VIRHA|nr:RsfA family transcriptional regulator [Virgibacillus halodenitrificans]APC48169.1 transcriptional regulator [Virgibacillus halodenitrificans]MBD1222897.1 RsfA family transcriptional regulator [Virgibacillus halodenitrificans]MCG1029955.1 RsfA family transcriptional regulator [Virgibacillus halodenitrificans]MCJ0930765.1 RsfA family transcriptional regulator [Virgibacillus halodenitrificans]MEC2159997.1 RsfA family transcriptional regulator [Virgibacillus halodenitrificans]
MVKVRQDAWSHEDDLLLAETVLRHIREGSTQLNAFEEVGDKLNRTSAACGFRWNAEVRSKYENAIDLAKRQRKEKKRAIAAAGQKLSKPVIELPQTEEGQLESIIEESEKTNGTGTLTIDTVIRFLKELKRDYYASNQSKNTLEQYKKNNLKLHEQVNQLEKQLAQTEAQLSTIQEDYQVFIQIMDRARKMTVLDDQGSMPSPAFRMDKNGNLQQLAQGN